MKKIAICGGHLTPALALIETLQKEKNLEIVFFGREHATEGSKNPSSEYQIIKGKNIKFIKLTAGRLQRKFTKHTVPSLVKVPLGFLQALVYLALERPSIVVAFGSYLSTPVVLAAWLLGIESATHEQAAVPGLANRINAIFSKKVFLSWPQSQVYFPKEKTQVVGNLTRQSLFKKTASDPQLEKFTKNAKTLLFFAGGNQGSHFINELVTKLLPGLKGYSVLHQVGTANYEGDLDKAKKAKTENYLPVSFLGPDDFGASLQRASLVISRSGANTVWDVAVLQKTAIFIPLPHAAGDEQYHNAKILENAGTAKIITQKKADPKTLEGEIINVIKNAKGYLAKAEEFSKTLPKDAQEKVKEYILTN